VLELAKKLGFNLDDGGSWANMGDEGYEPDEPFSRR
jgi:hypothetical protein